MGAVMPRSRFRTPLGMVLIVLIGVSVSFAAAERTGRTPVRRFV